MDLIFYLQSATTQLSYCSDSSELVDLLQNNIWYLLFLNTKSIQKYKYDSYNVLLLIVIG